MRPVIALRSSPRSGLAAVLLLAGVCVACVHKPEVHLDHAEISGVTLASTPPMPPSIAVVMTVVLNVYNPNSYDVAVRGVRGQAILAGQYPLPVQFQAPPPDGLWMPAGQTTAVRVPITVPIQLALTLVQQGVALPTISYRFQGTADVTASHTFQLEKDNYEVDESGTITRDDMLRVIPASIQASPFFPH
jgi:Late embryogenesis abundant protein